MIASLSRRDLWFMVSLLLNVLILGGYVTSLLVKIVHSSTSVQESSFEPSTQREVIDRMRRSSERELAYQLISKIKFSGRLYIRDLALYNLLDRFDIDLQTALGREIKPLHASFHHEGSFFPFYDDLSDEDFALIQRFILAERYPMTTKALFGKVQRGELEDPKARQALRLRKEMKTIYEKVAHHYSIDEESFLETLLHEEWTKVEGWVLLAERNREQFEGWMEECIALFTRPATSFCITEEKEICIVPKEEKWYSVEAGDCLWMIAKRHETSVALLKEINGLTDDLLHPGQRLLLP